MASTPDIASPLRRVLVPSVKAASLWVSVQSSSSSAIRHYGVRLFILQNSAVLFWLYSLENCLCAPQGSTCEDVLQCCLQEWRIGTTFKSLTGDPECTYYIVVLCCIALPCTVITAFPVAETICFSRGGVEAGEAEQWLRALTTGFPRGLKVSSQHPQSLALTASGLRWSVNMGGGGVKREKLSSWRCEAKRKKEIGTSSKIQGTRKVWLPLPGPRLL